MRFGLQKISSWFNCFGHELQATRAPHKRQTGPDQFVSENPPNFGPRADSWREPRVDCLHVLPSNASDHAKPVTIRLDRRSATHDVKIRSGQGLVAEISTPMYPPETWKVISSELAGDYQRARRQARPVPGAPMIETFNWYCVKASPGPREVKFEGHRHLDNVRLSYSLIVHVVEDGERPVSTKSFSP